MNGFAALDIPPCRRYVVVKATAGFAVCRLILKLLLFYSCLDFTQNLGKTRVESIAALAKITFAQPVRCRQLLHQGADGRRALVLLALVRRAGFLAILFIVLFAVFQVLVLFLC